MGVDKSNIRTVIHLEISPTVESYIQEVGRAARDGGTGTGYMLYSHSDSKKLAGFPEGSRERLMKGYAESSTCRRQFLLEALGGEETMCSGCDICDRKNKAPFAEDALYVLNIVKKNRFRFTIESLSQFLMEKFNEDFQKKNPAILNAQSVTSTASRMCRILYLSFSTRTL